MGEGAIGGSGGGEGGKGGAGERGRYGERGGEEVEDVEIYLFIYLDEIDVEMVEEGVLQRTRSRG